MVRRMRGAVLLALIFLTCQVGRPVSAQEDIHLPAFVTNAYLDPGWPEPRRPKLYVTFDRPMDPASVAAALGTEPASTLSLHWQNLTLIASVDSPLIPGVEYHFRLAGTAADLQGDRMGDGLALSYTPPEVLSYASYPTLLARDAPVVLVFNYAMDPESVRQSLSTEPPMDFDWSWSDDGHMLTLTPVAPLPPELDFVLRFQHGLQDSQGEPMPAPPAISFTTPPPILRTYPLDGEWVHPAAAVEMEFEGAMDPASTEAAFHITPAVPGGFSWQDNTLIFRPEQDYLAEHTTYTVTLATTALTADSQPLLRRPFSWSFNTTGRDNVAHFGWGANAQVVDADGRRAIQFSVFNQLPIPVQFELYRLELPQFLDRYASGFRGVAGYEDRLIDFADLPLETRWEQSVARRSTAQYADFAQETQIPPTVAPGLYLLNLTAGQVNDQLLVILSRHVLVIKQAEGQMVAWVTDINGAPAANADVEIYARDGSRLAQGRADAHGLYRTALAQDPQPLMVIARVADDVTAIGLSPEWQSRGDLGWGWWEPAPVAQRYAVHTYTERPIYRPGQTVFFKTIVRQDDDAVIGLPPGGTPLTARLRDARNNLVQSLELTTNGFGTAHGAFQLAEGAMLGDYQVEIALDGENHRQTFKVQDYRKPDYAVAVETHAGQLVVGEMVTVTLSAAYLFGEPVADAQVVLHQFELAPRQWWDPDTREAYTWYESSQPPVHARTDAQGRLTITFTAQMGNTGHPVSWQADLLQTIWGVEASVDDGSHQTVSSLAVFHVYSAAEALTLETDGYFRQPGVPFTVTLTAAGIDGTPVSDRGVELALIPYGRPGAEQRALTPQAGLNTDGEGKVQLPLTVDEPGYYELRADATDSLGNAIGYSTWLYVFDQTSPWITSNQGDLRIRAQQDTFAPGDVARLVVESATDGPALLTVERGTTRREQLVQLHSPLTVVELPVQADDAPNIFVTISTWEAQDTRLTDATWTNLPDSRLRQDQVELHVPVTDKTLRVAILSDGERYGPREEATFAVQVTDEAGQPVVAELSLALVDEAIFALSEDLAGPIFDAFYAEREHGVRTYDGMALIRWLGGGGGGGGDGGLLASPRRDFADTALWLPAIQTDATGRATVTVTLPDNLTRWRMTVKATTGPETQVGEAYTHITTWQPIVVRPLLPRGLTAGDELAISALVQNHDDQVRQLAVGLQGDDALLALQGAVTQTLRLEPGEVKVVGWPAQARMPGQVELTVWAVDEASTLGDSVELPLEIRPLAVPEVINQVGLVEGAFTATVQLPPGALAMSQVRIELSRSIAGSMLQGLEYLTGFPYGCVEQTMSRALPNAVVGRALHQIGIDHSTLAVDLPLLIDAGVQRLYGYQHNDGGWGWWYDDSSQDYQTAWVVFGLAVTAEAGYPVDPQVIDRGVSWLAAHLAEMDLRTRAFALYSMAMAGQGDLEATRSLAAEMEQPGSPQDAFSQAALALSLYRLGLEPLAQEWLDALAAAATVEEDHVYWLNPAEDGHYYQKNMASSVRSTALALSAFVQIRPGHPLEAGIVRWLMAQRRGEGWGSTNETAFTLLALTDHLLANQEAIPDAGYTVQLNGESIAGGALGLGELTGTVIIPAGQMAPGDNQVVLLATAGSLYYAVQQRLYLPQAEIGPAGNVEIRRLYLDPVSGQEVAWVAAGQLVQVLLSVRVSERAFYLLVEDRLPGGLEALNEGLNTTSHVAADFLEPVLYWQEYGYNHKEIWGDRVSFFITELSPGLHTYSYLARATQEGHFLALPAEAAAMYDTTTWGRSASSVLRVGASE